MLKYSRWFSNSGKCVFISLHQALKAAVATSSSNSQRLHSYQGGTERKGPEVFLSPRWFGPGRYFVHGAGLEATMECGWFGLATRLSSTRITYAIKFVGWNKIRYEVSCRKSGWFFFRRWNYERSRIFRRISKDPVFLVKHHTISLALLKLSPLP